MRALKNLADECQVNKTRYVTPDLVDGHFYGARLTILAGLLGAYDLFRQKFEREARMPFVGQFLSDYLPHVRVWGESATPFLAITALALETYGRQRDAEALTLQVARSIAEANGSRGRGIPSTYYARKSRFG